MIDEDEYIDGQIQGILDNVVFLKAQIVFLLWRGETLQESLVNFREEAKE